MRTDSRELLAVGIFGGKSRLGDRIEFLLKRGRTFSPRVSAAGVAASALVLGGLVLAGSLAPRWIAFAQTPAGPSFEVTSIKPSEPSDKPGFLQTAPRRLDLNGVTVKMLIQQAYTISGYRIYGGSSWLDSARFNISAKAGDEAGKLTMNQMRPMLQTLLADRFRLAVHRETKELPLYRLVVSKRGPKFRESTVSGEPKSRMGMGQITDEKAGMDALASQLDGAQGRLQLSCGMDARSGPEPGRRYRYSVASRCGWAFHLYSAAAATRVEA
jgi:Protein of unknown function (DUF3738)